MQLSLPAFDNMSTHEKINIMNPRRVQRREAKIRRRFFVQRNLKIHEDRMIRLEAERLVAAQQEAQRKREEEERLRLLAEEGGDGGSEMGADDSKSQSSPKIGPSASASKASVVQPANSNQQSAAELTKDNASREKLSVTQGSKANLQQSPAVAGESNSRNGSKNLTANLDETKSLESTKSKRSATSSVRSTTSRDVNQVIHELQQEKPPDKVNRGPFSVFAIIDGHRGEAVARFIEKYLLDIIYRNENIMCRKWFSMGLKQVFMKLEEVLRSDLAQEELRYLLGYPLAHVGGMFEPHTDPLVSEAEKNPAW